MTLLPQQPPSRAELVDHLVRTRVAGDVATARGSNLGNIAKMLDRDSDYWFGVELERPWTREEVLQVMAEQVGIDPDAARATGADRIDPQRCVDALDAAAQRLSDVASRRGTVLFATGHPTGLLALYLPIAAALAGVGCRVLTPAAERWVSVPPGVQRRIRYVGGVATIGTGGDLLHTHAPEPMQSILTGGERPDLVVADHGWAGAAGQAGLEVIGFADTNDPAMFVAAAEGKVAVAVPLDDNVEPASYAPIAAYVLAWDRPFGLARFVPPAP